MPYPLGQFWDTAADLCRTQPHSIAPQRIDFAGRRVQDTGIKGLETGFVNQMSRVRLLHPAPAAGRSYPPWGRPWLGGGISSRTWRPGCSAVLGKARIQVSGLLKLGRGAVIELDRKVGEAIDIYVNNRLVARGEVVVVEDRLGVTMTEIIKGGRS